jgi:hypothetical protein
METVLIEEIHEQFKVDLFEQVRQTNDFTFLQKVCPTGVKTEDFIDRVERYRVFYPGNNFVTEKQIAEVCRKYGLVLGSFMNFTGIIPVKNRLELKTFKLRAEDQILEDRSLPGRILTSLLDGRHGVEVGRIAGDVLELQSGFIPGDMEKPFELLPFADTFVLIAANTEHDIYRVFLKADFFGSEWLVDLGLASIADGFVWVEWKVDRVEGIGTKFPRLIHQFRATLRLPTTVIGNTTKINLSANVCPVVVAPGTMFERYKGAVEVSDYILRFKPGMSPVDATSFLHIDDPIILQPVKYGYLVVTKWGKESSIGEIQNAKTN